MATFIIQPRQTEFTIVNEPNRLILRTSERGPILLRTAERVVASEPAGPAGGDLSGTYPNPDVASLQGVGVPPAPPTAGQVLKATSPTTTEWADEDDSALTGDVSGTLSANQVDALQGVAISGTPAVGDVLAATSPTAASWAPPAGGGGGGGSGWIYCEDVTAPGGSESDRVFQDSGNTVLQSLTVSQTNVQVAVKASYPLVEVDGNAATLARDPSGGFYSGTVSVNLSGSGSITSKVFTPDDAEGAEDTTVITVDAPPVITAATFTGGYPGAQTELKENDTFQLQVTADKNFDLVEVQDFEAGKFSSQAVAVGLSATVTVTIADRGNSATLRPARVRVRDASTGAFSAVFDTSSGGAVDGVNVVNLNNLFPTASFGAITYPASQQALKASETATVAITLANQDSAIYDSPNGDLDTAGFPTVQRIAGSYNVATNNLRVTANRAANDATTVDQTVVNIANVAPTINVSVPAARLRSGGNDGTSAQSYTVTISANQQLASAPTLAADSGGNRGTFLGGGFAGGPSTWTRSLQVNEGVPDEKGTFAFESLVATGLSGLVQNTINSGAAYTLGGFVARTITVPAFASSVQFGVEVADFSKVEADNFSPGGPSVRQPIGTVADTVNGYTIDAVGVNPTTLVLLDQAAIAANSLGLYNLANLEEAV